MRIDKGGGPPVGVRGKGQGKRFVSGESGRVGMSRRVTGMAGPYRNAILEIPGVYILSAYGRLVAQIVSGG